MGSMFGADLKKHFCDCRGICQMQNKDILSMNIF